MKKILIVLFLTISFFVKAQKIKGKIYMAETNMSCERLLGGGGSVTINYCYLKFEKKYVNVFYKITVLSSPPDKSSDGDFILEGNNYKYKQTSNIIKIDEFNDFGILTIEEGKLIGSKKANYQEYKKIEFNEETCQKR